jgi:ankyrin repeat protein
MQSTRSADGQGKKGDSGQGKKGDSEGNMNFTAVLRTALKLANKVKEGELTDYDAAKCLLSHTCLLDENKYFLASTCRVDSDYVNTTDGHGNTALHWAAFKNAVDCASVLLSHKSNPNAVAKASGWTPLHDAAYSDSIETLSLLISYGADVNAKANSGATPLCFAAQEDAPNATRILLEAGADPSVRCCDDASANDGDSDRDRGFVHQHLNRFSGYTPLHYCTHYNAHRAGRVLLQYHNRVLVPANKSLLEIPDLNDKLPIHVAVARGSSDVLRELLHYGARVDTPGRIRTCSDSDQSTASMGSIDFPMRRDEGAAVGRSHSFDAQMSDDEAGTSSPRPLSAIITPVSSPVLGL